MIIKWYKKGKKTQINNKHIFRKMINMKKTYNKLVRDKIPEKIEKNNEKPIIEVLDDIKYLKELKLKLSEELNEYLENGDIEELADLQEVILAILKFQDTSLEDFERIRINKALKNGSFDKRFFLKGVE